LNSTLSVPYLSVDLDSLDHNIDVICAHQNIGVERIIAVVKDSGYGIGSLPMARSYEAKGVRYFAVATIREALFLRENGITGEILHMGLSDECDISTAIEQNITLTVVDQSQLAIFGTADSLPKLHLIIDTGMNRNGLRCDELLNSRFEKPLQRIIDSVTGVYTHFHSSDQPDQGETEKQRELFLRAQNYLKTVGMGEVVVHSSNSGAVIYGSVPEGELVRPGIMLHGIVPDCGTVDINLKEVSSLYSKVSSIRKVYVGEGVGYSHLYKPESEGTVVTIPIGYGDGFSRALTQGCSVLIRGKRYPVLARVTMDYILVDLGDDPVEIGDRVTLIGSDGDESISLCELSQAIDTIPYEILCQVGSSMAHHYHRSGVDQSSREQIVF
jgi:alanine racemase